MKADVYLGNIHNCLQCGRRLRQFRKTGLCRECYFLLQKAQKSYKPTIRYVS